jgi:uncharacterized membrane protein YcaP (DUF421 family)
VLLLIISEVTQQALVGDDDFSLTAGLILILTLVGLDILISVLKDSSEPAAKVMDGVPMLLLENGNPIQQTLKKERVDEAEILAQAREGHGIESLDQIKYAVLEADGKIGIVPREDASQIGEKLTRGRETSPAATRRKAEPAGAK